ncbi:MAG: chromophore lyase CpcT/CpeT [Gammaproteobacteria bacterium]|nr:chromophore lyase CpcT/CpeT [Gammaproteobacteria bacterium]
MPTTPVRPCVLMVALLALFTSPASAQLPFERSVADNPAAVLVLHADLAELLEWFEGRFDNDREVFFAEAAGVPVDARNGRIHSIFRRVDLPAFGEHVFYVEQYSGNDPTAIYRQRIYVFVADAEANAIRLDIHAPLDAAALAGAWREPSKLAGLTPEQARAFPGCEVYWRRRENQFVGETRRGACRVESRQSGRLLVIEDDLVLTPEAIWIRDRAETEDGEYVYGNRAGRAHGGGMGRPSPGGAAGVRGAQHGDSGEGLADWKFQREVWLHDQGGVARLVTDEAPPRNVELHLRLAEWPARDRRASLTLYVHETGNERAVSYAWAEADAERIGINLRWLQASCTHTPEAWGP